MPSIQRRAVLGALATASTIAGCLFTPETTTESTSPTDTLTNHLDDARARPDRDADGGVNERHRLHPTHVVD